MSDSGFGWYAKISKKASSRRPFLILLFSELFPFFFFASCRPTGCAWPIFYDWAFPLDSPFRSFTLPAAVFSFNDNVLRGFRRKPGAGSAVNRLSAPGYFTALAFFPQFLRSCCQSNLRFIDLVRPPRPRHTMPWAVPPTGRPPTGRALPDPES